MKAEQIKSLKENNFQQDKNGVWHKPFEHGGVKYHTVVIVDKHGAQVGLRLQRHGEVLSSKPQARVKTEVVDEPQRQTPAAHGTTTTKIKAGE